MGGAGMLTCELPNLGFASSIGPLDAANPHAWIVIAYLS